MKIPNQLSLSALQEFARDVTQVLDTLTVRNVDLGRRRIINAGHSQQPFDYVTRAELDKLSSTVDANVQRTAVVSTTTAPSGALNASTELRFGTYANRGAATAHTNTIYLASDRSYIGFYSTGSVWVYAFGFHRDTFANRPTPTADETNYAFYATDTFRLYFWTGAAWVEDILSVLEQFGGTTSSFPALKRSTTTLQVRLADDSLYTTLECGDFGQKGTSLGFFNHSVQTQQSSAAVTNNVTSGGSSDVIADFTNLTVYATDAGTIRDDIYQLARKVKEIGDALRLYGLLA